MKRICMGSLLGQALFVFLLAATATAAYGMKYTGYVVDLEHHDSDHITLGLDGGGDGVADLTNDYYDVDTEELQTLQDAKREGTQVTITYHLSGGKLMLDKVAAYKGSSDGKYIMKDGVFYLIDPETGALIQCDEHIAE